MRMFRVYFYAFADIKRYWTDGGWTDSVCDAEAMSESAVEWFVKQQPECSYEEIKRREPVILFILIQDNKILDRASRPEHLFIERLDAYAGFKIAIGCINEWGEREIAGVVADVGLLSGAKTWRISSDVDGLYRLIGAAECPAALAVKRLSVLHTAGKFNDIANLPMRVLITTFGPTTPLSTEDVADMFVPG